MGKTVAKIEVKKVPKKDSLNKEDVKALPPGTHQIERGLYIRKGKTSGSFFYRVQVKGARHDIGLGSDLAAARKRAVQIRADVANGLTPWKKDESGVTFGEYWEQAFNTYAETRAWKRESQRTVALSMIRRYALPKLSSVKLTDIDRNVVLDVLKDLWKEKPLLASRLRIYVAKIFDIAVVSNIMKTNPAAWEGNLSLFLPPVSSVHRAGHWAALPFDDTKELLWKLLASKYATHRLTVLLIMTARRVSEALNAKWSDVDLDAGIWTVPDEHMKVSRHVDRRVPLPRQLIEAMRSWPRNSEWVFSADGKKHLDIDGIRKPLKRQSGKNITMHGFRSTFTDWAAENGIPTEVAEKCLDHDTGTKVRQAYQRSDLLELRRDALQKGSSKNSKKGELAVMTTPL